jgi:hypothetical protein
MSRLLPRWLCVLTICSVPGLAASVCVTDTLSDYIALGATGCQLGVLTVTNFNYSYVSGDVIIAASSITVTPSTAPDLVGLMFSSTDFSVPNTDSAVYSLGYTFDPADIRSLEDILNADPPTYPGLAQVTTVDCENAAFSPGCSTSTDTVVVSDNGLSLNSPNSVAFSSPVTTLGIENTIDLDATSGGSAEFTSIENQLTLPEPSTAVPCLLLGALVLGRLGLQRFQRRR